VLEVVVPKWPDGVMSWLEAHLNLGAQFGVLVVAL